MEKRWLIESDVIIGRENNCEIVVPDRQVSRHHARISLRDRQGVMLEDLGSKRMAPFATVTR
jgi:pSer/pThr/pTyr-binding forkhead associated (FHA) protein